MPDGLIIPSGSITDGTISVSILAINDLIEKVRQLEERIVELENK